MERDSPYVVGSSVSFRGTLGHFLERVAAMIIVTLKRNVNREVAKIRSKYLVNCSCMDEFEKEIMWA